MPMTAWMVLTNSAQFKPISSESISSTHASAISSTTSMPCVNVPNEEPMTMLQTLTSFTLPLFPSVTAEPRSNKKSARDRNQILYGITSSGDMVHLHSTDFLPSQPHAFRQPSLNTSLTRANTNEAPDHRAPYVALSLVDILPNAPANVVAANPDARVAQN
eukprot:CAMPEP_0202688466 /NCGR_PEP_ID=MMETSP1385-20130828/3975_1 /ASSEMBLY_ACC=CAM_ASM_000861 /TAXON_ID=933848 /ORGANISM="Elphidium margaritaceum" /LENGTH=160 /DNA_ID=CAMNT_0049343455 /DNA_START=260 /DNA_END=742 /DNA_ORIENTATION=+